jgi:TonB family protein
MSQKLWDHDQVYKRRVLVVVPVAIVILVVLFATSDHVSIEEIEKQVGWKGAMEVLPEISIIFDDDDVTTPEMMRRAYTMTSVDLDLAETGELETQAQDADRPEEEKQFDWSEWDDFNVRTLQTNRAVPYSDEYVLLKMIEPVYPTDERSAGVEGNVLVELLINQAGLVETVNILSWMGPQSFRESTLDAVKQFQYQPPVEDGKPTTMWVKFMVRFRISG